MRRHPTLLVVLLFVLTIDDFSIEGSTGSVISHRQDKKLDCCHTSSLTERRRIVRLASIYILFSPYTRSDACFSLSIEVARLDHVCISSILQIKTMARYSGLLVIFGALVILASNGNRRWG